MTHSSSSTDAPVGTSSDLTGARHDQSICFGMTEDWKVLWTSPNVAHWLPSPSPDLRGNDFRKIVSFSSPLDAFDAFRSEQSDVWFAEGRFVARRLTKSQAALHRWTLYRLSMNNPMGRWLAVTQPTAASDDSLSDSAGRLQTAAQLNGVVAFEWSLGENRWYWSCAYSQLLGLREDDLPATWEQWLERIDPDDRYIVERSVAEALASFAPIKAHYRVRHADGHWINVSERSRYFVSHNGQANRLVGCLTGGTQERRWKRRFQRLISDSPVGVLLTDSQGQIHYANPAAGDVFGHPHHDLFSYHLDSLIPTASRRLREAAPPAQSPSPVQSPDSTTNDIAVDDSLSKTSLTYPEKGIRKDGSSFPIHFVARAISEDDQVLYSWTVSDLSDQIKGARLLAESERRLHDILDFTTAVIYVKQLDGKYLLVNRQFEQLFQVTRQKVVGMTDYDLFPRDLADAFRVNDVRVARGGEALEIEEIAPHVDGPHHYLSLKFPLRDSDGAIYAVAGISTDISERVLAEQGLQQVNEQLELILDSVSDGIVGIDPNGRIVFANRASETQLQASEDELVGRSINEVFGQEFPLVLHDQATEAQLVQVQRSDKTVFPAEILHRPLGQGYLRQGTVLTIRDQTDRRKREAVERELASARAVQQALYPRQSPKVSGLDISGRVYPAEDLSGDYLDFIHLAPHELAFAVGDVSGHGFGPALAMVETRAYLRGLVRSGVDCHVALERLNQELVSDMLADVFVTLFLGRISTKDRRLTFASAGHEGLFFPHAGPPRILSGTGMLLGVDEEADYPHSSCVDLSAGDLIAVLTDGVHEATMPDGKELGRENLMQLIQDNRHRSAVEISEILYRTATAISGAQQEDDITILIAKVLEPQQMD